MEIIIAEHSGYCFGVKRALAMVEETLAERKNVNTYAIGSIIHNRGVIDLFLKKGLKIIKNPEEIKSNDSIFIIRSHGVSQKLFNELKAKNIKIVDTTCPFVKNIQKKARILSKNNYFVIIIGDKEHPEVIGIRDNILGDNYIIVDNVKELRDLEFKDKIGIVVQTTQKIKKLKSITNKVIDKTNNLMVCNTICHTTRERQDAIKKLAKKTDIMIIVGGKDSANTKHLYEIAKNENSSTYHIENFKELDISWFKDVKIAGISGGASTPINDIFEVRNIINSYKGS